MLITIQHLIDRTRHARTRADEVLAVRRRLAAVPRGSEAEVNAARELAGLREELAVAFGAVRSCSGCARGHSLPHGRWSGGQCCGGQTEAIFTDDELRALRLAGTTPGRLRPPAGDHAGCAFRGPEGCSLEVVDRPNLCVRYVCRELEGELRASGKLASVKALSAKLNAAFARFVRLAQPGARADKV